MDVRSSLINISTSREPELDEIEFDYEALYYKTTVIKVLKCKKQIEANELIGFIKKEFINENSRSRNAKKLLCKVTSGKH